MDTCPSPGYVNRVNEFIRFRRCYRIKLAFIIATLVLVLGSKKVEGAGYGSIEGAGGIHDLFVLISRHAVRPYCP